MTRKQIEKFAVGYPYPTSYIEILLQKYNYDKIKVDKILQKPYNIIVIEVQNHNTNGITIDGLLSILDARNRKRNKVNE